MTDNETDLDYSQREAITKDIDKKLTTDWVEGLKLLRSYDNHESEDLKRDILAMVWRFALRSNDSTVRQELVNYLLDVVAHETLFLQGQAIKFLQDFSPSDFDKRATERLESWSWAEEYGSEIIRLIGIAEIHSKTLE